MREGCQGTTRINQKQTNSVLWFGTGAGEGIRTPDRLITNQVLYQLSYASAKTAQRRLTPRRKAEHTTRLRGGDSMGRMWQSTWRFRQLRTLFRPSAAAALSLCLPVGTRLAYTQSTAAQDGPLVADADTTKAHALTNDTIIKMSKAGLEDGVIIQTIRNGAGRYDTSPDALIALKNAGVSQRVIAVMQAHKSGLADRDAEANPAVGTPTALAPGIDEIGAYYKDKDGQWAPLKTERVQFRSSGWLKNAASDGLIKQDQNGHLDGAKSPLKLPTGVQIMIYTPPGTQAEEYDFIRFHEHSGSRDFRVKTGGLFHSETGSLRDEIVWTPKKIGKDMYVFTVPTDIEKGEYGVLPPGSSNTPGLANAGKIFTFSILE